MASKSPLYGVGIFLGILAIIFLVVFFFWFFLIGIALFLCFIVVGIIILLAIIALVLLFAIPYYAITKKPEVQTRGSYGLEEVKDKDDEARTNK
ncbi:hypothetical protein [[Eubacterium] cellulosolvens]